jgi:ABC-2 type transport system ATP-binding protein
LSEAAATHAAVFDTLAIEATALTKRYGNFLAVDHVDLAVGRGELFGLLGPNGSGKTTLVRMLTTLIPITSGSARVAHVDVVQHPDQARRAIGVVPQALTSDLDLTAYENMDIYARFFGVGRDARKTRIERLLERVSLWDRRNDLVKTFSGGMRRRLEIARGLLHRPRVLFLDEPTIGLDPQSRHAIWDLLRELRAGGPEESASGAEPLTISLTTHYLDEAEVLCDRVAIVDHGKIVALGTPQELKSRVPGSDTVDLAVRPPPTEDVLARLRALSGVRDVSVTADGLRIRADEGALLLPRAFDVLRESGRVVGSANVSRITLEDVFIHFTGRSLRDAPVDPLEARRAAMRARS